jgi:hypothetical protein
MHRSTRKEDLVTFHVTDFEGRTQVNIVTEAMPTALGFIILSNKVPVVRYFTLVQPTVR